MGIDDFSQDEDYSDKVRPYVSENTHQLVRDFTSRAGLSISEGYDLIIESVISDDELLQSIFVPDQVYAYPDLGEKQISLLEDIVHKYQEDSSFPDRGDINSDNSMHGFPIYVMNLGSLDQIKHLARCHMQEIEM